MRILPILFLVAAISCGGEPPTAQSVADEEGAGVSDTARSAPEDRSADEPAGREDNVRIDSPADGSAVVANPIEVSGTARTFENYVILQVRDSRGEQLLETSTTARGEIGHFNPWSTELWLTRWPGPEITLRAIEESARDGSIRSLETVTLRNEMRRREVILYFPNAETSPDDCSTVYPVTRVVPSSPGIARLLTEALIAGPTSSEKKRGFTSEFPRGTQVESIEINDGTLTVDLSSEARNVGGSCRAQAVRSSLDATLGQLSNVERVRITAAGSEELALQP
ncbi:MAG: Gmad2 immunoglobulin-like domain-containing protein [Thermoanaerobaculia bacterium]|nr:Gmad2 immunoglobulin-like domain-containing protein [Thermoanaerobaculia bacterium]